MTPQDALALTPGPELDQAVNLHVFNSAAKAPAFSTSDVEGIRLLDKLPLFVARVNPSHPHFDTARPWIAGTLAFDAATKGDVTTLRVASATRLAAICKAALLVTLQPAVITRAAPTSPAGGQIPANLARLRKKPGPKPKNQPAMPVRQAPRLPQPAPAHESRPPLPKRTKAFKGPTLFPAATS